MKTFKNKNFIKRDYDSTNIVFCQAQQAPSEDWIECDESELTNSTCNQLHRIVDEVYFGWL